MTTIDSTGRFLAQIREEVSAVARTARADAGARGTQARTGTRAPSRDIQRLILQRVLAIGADDPERRRKAFHVFLESVLADELGANLLTDPAYHQIASQVRQTMDQDAALGLAIEQAGEFLLQRAHRR